MTSSLEHQSAARQQYAGPHCRERPVPLIRPRFSVLLALLLAALCLSACGSDDPVNKTDRSRAEADARASFGIIRTAVLAHFKKTGKLPDEPTLAHFGIDEGQLRKTFYEAYEFELDGDPEDGYGGTTVTARPKEGSAAPLMVMTFEDMRSGAHKIRVK